MTDLISTSFWKLLGKLIQVLNKLKQYIEKTASQLKIIILNKNKIYAGCGRTHL
jgi:hypothetical protein